MEELLAATGGGVEQCFLVDIAFEDRQAIEMRANPANQHVVAVVQQMMGGDGCAHIGVSLTDELDGLAGGDVFEHHFECREAFHDPTQVFVDEQLFTVEDIDVAASDFTVNQQRHPDFGHGLQCGKDLVDAGDTRVRVGGRTGRIELGGVDETTGLGLANLLRLGTIGQVEHHQRFETAAGRARSENALAIGIGLRGVAHRWYQVGHDDGATKGARDIRNSIG